MHCYRMSKLSDWRRRMSVSRWQSRLHSCVSSRGSWKDLLSAGALLYRRSFWKCFLAGLHFPLPAVVEVLQDYVTNYHKARLHLILMDLWKSWKSNTSRAKTSQTICSLSRMVRVFVEWVHFVPVALGLVLLKAMRWILLSFLAIWCGRRERSSRMSYWMLPRMSLSAS